MSKIKKIKRLIYDMDFKTNLVPLNSEILRDEFITMFKHNDIKNNITVIPIINYEQTGLAYSGNEIKAHENWDPAVVTFKLSIFGLKKGEWYRITVISRSAAEFSLITNDRTLFVKNNIGDIIINEDLTRKYNNEKYEGFFRATSGNVDLEVKLGKIFISKFKIEEIEFVDESYEKTKKLGEYGPGKYELKSWGVFKMDTNYNQPNKKGWIEIPRISGDGIKIYFDKKSNQYILERDIDNDLIGESFGDIQYVIEFNENKLINFVNGSTIYDKLVVLEHSSAIAPNSLRDGYLKFGFVKDEKLIEYKFNGSSFLYVFVRKVN